MKNQQQQEYDGYTNRDSSFNTIDTGSGFHHSMNSYLYINSKHTTEPPSIIFKAYCELCTDHEFRNVKLSIAYIRLSPDNFGNKQ